MEDHFSSTPHRRYNILTGEWILVSPHRTKRPWQGKQEEKVKKEKISYDPNCYLCANNERMGGSVNPDYQNTFVFPNDFGALLSDSAPFAVNEGLLTAQSERGICRVICFSPNHSETLPDMSVEAIEKVIEVWQNEYADLASKDFINHVQIFENKGAIMGCSNPHPHGQIWAQENIPTEVIKKTENQRAYFEKHGKSLLEAYVDQELAKGERIIYENETFVSLVPFWAVWPYETMILPKIQVAHIGLLSEQEKSDYAKQIKIVTAKYDKLFDTSFPYSAGIHQSPTDKEYEEWHMHMSFYPPLLRSATVKKFMVGYEMFGMPQRDITAEQAAATLKML